MRKVVFERKVFRFLAVMCVAASMAPIGNMEKRICAGIGLGFVLIDYFWDY